MRKAGLHFAIQRTREELQPKVKCEAVIYHGAGHQSRTRCRLTGPHEVHEAIYGSGQQLAQWQGDEAITGFFDEPPEVPE